jgi:hypothetical protein
VGLHEDLRAIGVDPAALDPGLLAALEDASQPPADTRQPTPRRPDAGTLARRKWLRQQGTAVSHGDIDDLLEALPPEVHAEVRRVAADAAEARSGGAQHAATIDAADRVEALEPKLPPGWKPPKVDRDEIRAIADRVPRP